MTQHYTTTKGDTFTIETDNDDIIFTDNYGDTLTWDNNALNRRHIDSMINEITIKEHIAA